MPRYTMAQLATALRAGPPPPVDVADDAAGHLRQEQWLAAFLPKLQLPPPCEPKRREMWKAATRKHTKMVKQIAMDFKSCRDELTAWANGSSERIGGSSRTPLEVLLWLIGAEDAERLPRCAKMRKKDALLYPPPNLYDYEEDARGPGSAPAVWFRHWYGRDYDGSKHRGDYERARILWRRMVPEEQRAAALSARPMPLQVLLPSSLLLLTSSSPPHLLNSSPPAEPAAAHHPRQRASLSSTELAALHEGGAWAGLCAIPLVRTDDGRGFAV